MPSAIGCDLGLKVIANASSYGILAQMDPSDLPGRKRQLKSRCTVHSARFDHKRSSRNGPGHISFRRSPRSSRRRTLHAGDAGAVRDGRRRGVRDGRHRLDGDCRHGATAVSFRAQEARRRGGARTPHATTDQTLTPQAKPSSALSFEDVNEIAGRFETSIPTPARSRGSFSRSKESILTVADPGSSGVTRSRPNDTPSIRSTSKRAARRS